MATANPLGEDTFDLEINRVRRKIKAKFIDLIDCLKARENELLRQLNSILVSYHLYRSELERFHEKKRDLENMQNALKEWNMHESMLLQIRTEMKSMWTPSLIEPKIQSTPLNRATSGPVYFDPIKRRNLLTENMLF